VFFYQAAIDAALGARDLAAAERYAAALEEYTRPEPLPWADFIVARGRALAAGGRGERDGKADERLLALRALTERIGLKRPRRARNTTAPNPCSGPISSSRAAGRWRHGAAASAMPRRSSDCGRCVHKPSEPG